MCVEKRLLYGVGYNLIVSCRDGGKGRKKGKGFLDIFRRKDKESAPTAQPTAATPPQSKCAPLRMRRVGLMVSPCPPPPRLYTCA